MLLRPTEFSKKQFKPDSEAVVQGQACYRGFTLRPPAELLYSIDYQSKTAKQLISYLGTDLILFNLVVALHHAEIPCLPSFTPLDPAAVIKVGSKRAMDAPEDENDKEKRQKAESKEADLTPPVDPTDTAQGGQHREPVNEKAKGSNEGKPDGEAVEEEGTGDSK